LRRRKAEECKKNLQNTRSKIPFDNELGVVVAAVVVVVVVLLSLLLLFCSHCCC
jgi:hypothetical protein